MENEEVARIIREAIASSVWSTPPVDEEPVIHLSHWQVFDLAGEFRFAGYHDAGQEGRLSTVIQAFDSQTLKAVTRSGRVYVLEGPAGSHPDAEWVLDRWLDARGKRRADIRFVPLNELHDDSQGNEPG